MFSERSDDSGEEWSQYYSVCTRVGLLCNLTGSLSVQPETSSAPPQWHLLVLRVNCCWAGNKFSVMLYDDYVLPIRRIRVMYLWCIVELSLCRWIIPFHTNLLFGLDWTGRSTNERLRSDWCTGDGGWILPAMDEKSRSAPIRFFVSKSLEIFITRSSVSVGQLGTC